MLIADVQCYHCKHYEATGLPMTCTAFPSGIPEPILVGLHDHRKPYGGEHGVRFEVRIEDDSSGG